MTSRTDITIDWLTDPRIFTVLAPSTELLIQDAVDTCRDLEYTFRGMSEPLLMSASGKQVVSGGLVGITAAFQNFKVAFQQRADAIVTGTITSAAQPIANGISVIDSAATFITSGISTGDTFVNLPDSSHASVKRVVSETELFCTLLDGGAENDLDFGEAYRIYPNTLCKIQGGNSTAVDELQVAIEPAFPTFGTFVEIAQSTSPTLVETGVSGLTPAESTALINLNTNVASNTLDIAAIQADLAVMNRPKKNQPFGNFMFLMVSSVDLRTPLTGLTITGQVSIDGATLVPIQGTFTEVGMGIYSASLTADDTNGDSIMYIFSGTGALDRYIGIITS